jgi:hypothetical protein
VFLVSNGIFEDNNYTWFVDVFIFNVLAYKL